MNDARAPNPLRRDLRAITADGIAFSVMVGAGESYLSAFALALGKSETFAGLIAAVPMVIGAVLQLVTPTAVRWLGSPKRWVVGCALVQAGAFAPLVAAAFRGSLSAGWLFAVAAVYWAAGLATGPAWNTWVGAMVPRAIRPTFFAQRTRLAHLAVAIGLIGGGSILQYATSRGQATLGFAALFLIAACARLISAAFLARYSVPAAVRASDDHLGLRALLSSTSIGTERRLIVYLVAMQLAVQISGPYFTPYMLRELHLPYAQFMVLLATSYGAKMVVLPMLGRLAGRVGPRRLLVIGAIAIIPLPACWLVSGSFWYLLGLQMCAGSMWAIHELAVMLAFFESIPERERTGVLTLYNLGHASAVLVGALIGGFVLRRLGEDLAAYRAVFLGSTVLRVGAVSLIALVPSIRLIRGLRSVPVTRSVAVRPGVGSIERPVLAGLEDEEPL